MIKNLTLAGAAALAAVALGAPSRALAITGGHPSAVAYPFMGTLHRPDSSLPDLHVGGVELIASRWVITAAHRTRVGTGRQLVQVDRFTHLNNRYFVDARQTSMAAPVQSSTNRQPAG